MSTSAKNGQPTPPPRRDLAGAFDPSRRPTLGPRPSARSTEPAPTPAKTTSAPQDPQKPEPEKTAAEEPPTKTPAGEKSPAQARTRKSAPAHRTRASSAADRSLTKGCTLYLPDELCQQLAMARATMHRTRTQIVLDAVKATHQRLTELVEEDRRPTVVHTALWDEVVSPDTAPQPPKRQVFIEPTLQQLDVLNDLVTQTGARDRSHMCAVALRTYLQEGQEGP